MSDKELYQHIIIDPQWVTNQVLSLERRITAIHERDMRHSLIVEFISGLDEFELVSVLQEINLRSVDGYGPAREVLQEFSLEPCAMAYLPYKHIKKSYAIAMAKDFQAVAGMFLGAPLRQKSITIEEAFTGNDHMDLPLGIRRQAARTKDRFAIDRLLHDRDHRVISLLLENPRIVERDVISIAARRPTRPEILELISKHRKWASRYTIRKALCCNPYTPHQIAHRLLSTLMIQDLRNYVNTGVFSDNLIHEARRILNQRKNMNAPTQKEKLNYEEYAPKQQSDISAAAEALISFFDDIQDDAETIIPNQDIEVKEDELADLIGQAELDLASSVLIPVED